jgi:hypothetical protein
VRVGVLVDPNFPFTESFASDVRAAASSIRKQIEVVEAPTGRDIDTAFASLAQKPVDALAVAPSPLLNNRRVQLVTLATYHRVPAIYFQREAVEAGGLMSYGASVADAYRQAGVYTGRILKSGKPADLPVMQSTTTGCGSKAANSSGHQRRLLISLHSRTTEFPPSSGSQRPCRDAGVGAIALGLAMLDRAKRASHIDPPASSYAIMRKARPTAERNPVPGKDVRGELDPTPGIREQPRPKAGIDGTEIPQCGTSKSSLPYHVYRRIPLPA